MNASSKPLDWRPRVAMIAFPEMTMLDLIGPWETLRVACEMHLLGSTTDVFYSDTGLPFKADKLISEAEGDFDVVFVPGGDGSAPAMRDKQIIDFLADRGPRAKYVTSVCTGALVLGAAGLLRGYKATTHWSTMASLPLFGAIPVEERVVIDRNRITGGGVTAGIDFGLILLNEMLGEDAARFAQLLIEYTPEPPFNFGSPKTAKQVHFDKIMKYVEPLNASYREYAEANPYKAQ
ncbi:DJ-1/PfpI family protein [Mesorhizobium sp. CO1-1-8]|uniref:DJ-1/PfpI family protein n=1 Tax=Mesorhizobium sp. CO1-1-8 TaxID=2876631 RepID=UPI001CD05D56|nr:DJ-1/PfpI family protein [Mesorhizobium sp. CO1-1-8]MBZ9772480.1 DJ-1/PfpI family protein [Mesorhizobium sp. CO1-1-8]